MANLKLPDTIGGAVKRLNSLGELATATEWGRAAIVRAFVTKGNGRPRKTDENSSVLTIDAFARLGIVGMRSKDSVRRYYDAWNRTRLPDPEPGQYIELPFISFPQVEPRNPPPQISSPPPGSELEPCEPDEIVDAEIVDEPAPCMSSADAGRLMRDFEDSIPESQKAWESLRKANKFLMEFRNFLRNGVILDGPLSSGTVESYLLLTAEINPQLEGMS